MSGAVTNRHSLNNLDTLRDVYQAFAPTGHMDGRAFQKCMKDSGLKDGRLTVTQIDLIFAKNKEKGKKHIDLEDFILCLGDVGTRKRLDWQQVVDMVIAASGPRYDTGVTDSEEKRREALSNPDSLTGPERFFYDTNTYTGTWAQGQGIPTKTGVGHRDGADYKDFSKLIDRNYKPDDLLTRHKEAASQGGAVLSAPPGSPRNSGRPGPDSSGPASPRTSARPDTSGPASPRTSARPDTSGPASPRTMASRQQGDERRLPRPSSPGPTSPLSAPKQRFVRHSEMPRSPRSRGGRMQEEVACENCGEIFLPPLGDALFCRRCGSKRPEANPFSVGEQIIADEGELESWRTWTAFRGGNSEEEEQEERARATGQARAEAPRNWPSLEDTPGSDRQATSSRSSSAPTAESQKAVFYSFTRAQGRPEETNDMDGRTFQKCMKDTGLRGAGLSQADIDLIFAKCKAKGANKIDFENFQRCLEEVTQKKKMKKEEIWEYLMAAGGPIYDSGTTEVASAERGPQRFHDNSTYTGSHKVNPSRFGGAGDESDIAGDREVSCLSCGFAFLPDAKFCRKCGARRPEADTGRQKSMQSEESVDSQALGTSSAPVRGALQPQRPERPRPTGNGSFQPAPRATEGGGGQQLQSMRGPERFYHDKSSYTGTHKDANHTASLEPYAPKVGDLSQITRSGLGPKTGR